MMDQFEERRRSPALDEFRDQLGAEFVRVSRSKKRVGVRPGRKVVAASLAFVALGAGVAVAATTTSVGTTPITVTELNGETHPDTMGNAVVVPGPNGEAMIVPEANPTSDAAKADARRVAQEARQEARQN
jgi:hypothetical protein